MCLYYANSWQKTLSPCKITKFMSIKQRRVLMKSFIDSEFGYCPLIRMFHGREVNNKINHLHQRSLCIVYKDKSSFKELLLRDDSFTVRHKNIHSLV